MYIFIAILILLLLYTTVTYNGLITKKNKIKDSWSQIEVQLKRRFDLIPNLVNVVKGYAKYEEETLRKVVEVRTRFIKASSSKDALKANNELNEALGRLSVVVERYPSLKANQSYMDLQRQLVETENKISFARQFYTDVVMEYNNAVLRFPSKIIALIFNFKEAPYFEAEASERKNIEVNF